MDDESAAVVLSLQLEDMNRLLDSSVHIKEHVNISDGHIALVSYRDELAARLRFLQDRRMGRSMARAVLQDERTLRQVRSQENRAIEDRNLACRLGGANPGTGPTPIIDLTDDIPDRILTGLAQRYSALPDEPDPMEIDTEPRHTPVQRTRPLRNKSRIESVPALGESVLGVQKTCVSCDERINYFGAVYAPCGHDYCQDCAKQLFLNSMRDESLFPPRCCRQAIPLAAVDVFLTAEFTKHFEEKAVEFSTSDRLYCAWPTCSAFIPPAKINGDIAICPKCEFWVCTMCKGRTHQGRDCPKDAALNALISTAKTEGWQRCIRCKRYIELNLGCNHIT